MPEAKTAYRAAEADMRKSFLKELTKHGVTSLDDNANLQILVMSNQYQEAGLLIKKSLLGQRFPSASKLAKRAWLRTINGRQQDAIRDAREALEAEPTNEMAKLSLVLACLRAGKLAEASAHAGKALASDGPNATLFYARAAAKVGLGDRAGAAQDLDKAKLLQFDIMLDPALIDLKVG